MPVKLVLFFPTGFLEAFLKTGITFGTLTAPVNSVISYAFSYRCNILWALLDLSYLLDNWLSHFWLSWKNLWQDSLPLTNHILGFNVLLSISCLFCVNFTFSTFLDMFFQSIFLFLTSCSTTLNIPQNFFKEPQKQFLGNMHFFLNLSTMATSILFSWQFLLPETLIHVLLDTFCVADVDCQ